MDYVIEGLDPAAFKPYFGLDDTQLKSRNAARFQVDAKPGYPCRVSLEDAQVGETVILLNHVSRADNTPYRASHAIFVRERLGEGARFRNAVPEVFHSCILSLRGFDEAGMIIDARLRQPGEADSDLRGLFENDAVVEIDVHNAIRGCFSARARRA
ncbi:MAG: DUF1203 domain-containing protein [Erythrobacter sp.]|uniref:DUF1203 domain-containing protein n=1 Tax=Erythrobacter sp. TaxID=1042 RepID=UPI0026196ECC|nr:DUF1203 domain-containing protein [Erythrobacter sp.]MDJ0978801.1 DUF1203 domain-containing protein [Erythrobacter sp.]